jgi:hypothetical protein
MNKNFCSMSRHTVCKGDDHTGACRTREVLGKRLVTWLRDHSEADYRARVATDLGRPLDEVEMWKSFIKWEEQQSAQVFALSPASSNIIHHRIVPDCGSFLRVLDVAQQVIAEEIAVKVVLDGR